MPNSYKNKIKELLIFAGSKKTAEDFVNYSISISFAIGFVVALFSGSYFVFVWPIVSIAALALFHGLIVLAVERRTMFVEKILPDALQLMSANMKAGYIPSRAILLSARKEFGPLSDAIKHVGKEAITGKSFQDSLKTITRDIRSEVLETTVKLIIKGTKSGGQLVALFEETAADIRRLEIIKKDIRANILMYGIFIGFAACVGAPILYALSAFLVSTISGMGAAAQIPETLAARSPLMKFGVTVSSEFLFLFSLAAILITTTFAGIIMGLISSGKEKSGIKYIPLLAILALSIFFLAGIGINTMFGTLIPG
ncbi:MAG: type II secretion system F family protein [Nanoarchaeota archaeon]